MKPICCKNLFFSIVCCCFLIIPISAEAEFGAPNSGSTEFIDVDLSDAASCGSSSELEQYLLGEPNAVASCRANNPNQDGSNACCDVYQDRFYIRMIAFARCEDDQGRDDDYRCNITTCTWKFDETTCGRMEELCIRRVTGEHQGAYPGATGISCEITEGCQATSVPCPGGGLYGPCGIGDSGLGCEVADW